MGALTFDALLRSLKQGAPDPVYYLHGDEDVLKDEAIRALVEVARRRPGSRSVPRPRQHPAHARGRARGRDPRTRATPQDRQATPGAGALPRIPQPDDAAHPGTGGGRAA